jgi:hypothetical protein
MSKSKTSKNIICALNEEGGVGVKTDLNGIGYVRFTRLQDGAIAVCIRNQTPITKVSHDQFLSMARGLEGHILAMHS